MHTDSKEERMVYFGRPDTTPPTLAAPAAVPADRWPHGAPLSPSMCPGFPGAGILARPGPGAGLEGVSDGRAPRPCGRRRAACGRQQGATALLSPTWRHIGGLLGPGQGGGAGRAAGRRGRPPERWGRPPEPCPERHGGAVADHLLSRARRAGDASAVSKGAFRATPQPPSTRSPPLPFLSMPARRRRRILTSTSWPAACGTVLTCGAPASLGPTCRAAKWWGSPRQASTFGGPTWVGASCRAGVGRGR